MASECPTCDKTFETVRARNTHHTRVHGRSLVQETGVCNVCGSEFTYYTGDSNGTFCSKECQRETETGTKPGVCNYCGSEFEFYPSSEPGHYCSYSCKGKDKTGKDNPLWKERVAKECVTCGDEFKVIPSTKTRRKACSKECLADLNSDRFLGENHPRWRGGRSQTYYGRTWAIARKQYRANKCEMPKCEKTETDTGRKLHLHHQIPVHHFEDPENAHFESNLITLCAKHHTGPNGLEHRSYEPVRPPLEVK
jgi:hypothetical protein